MARPTIFNKEKAEIMVKAYADGLSLKDCAELAYITYECLNNWMNKGKDGDERYVQFFHDMTHARAQGNWQLLKEWKEAAKEDWRGKRDLLSVRNRDYAKSEHRTVEEELTLKADDKLRDAIRGKLRPKSK